MPLASKQNWLRVVSALVLLLLLVHGAIATQLQIDFYDSYENLLNARTVAGLKPEYHHCIRPPLTALLWAPLFLLERSGASITTVLLGSHLLAVACAAALFLAVYRLLRLDLANEWAATGTLLLALCPLVNHYLPMSRDDLPATLAITLAFLAYLKASQHESWKRCLIVGVLMGIAMGMRYNMVPLVIGLVWLHELCKGRLKLRLDRDMVMKAVAYGVTPCLIWVVIPFVVFPLAGRCSFWAVPAQLVQDYQYIKADQSRFVGSSSSLMDYEFLPEALTPPVLALAIAGLGIAACRRRGNWLFHLLWAVVFFVIHAHLVWHHEARYLLIMYPPLFYFAAIAFRELWELAMRKGTTVAVAVAMLLLTWPVCALARVLERYRDPVYTVGFEKEASELAASMAGSGKMIWVGPPYAVYPKDWRVIPGDLYTAMYHFAPHVLQLLTGRAPVMVDPDPVPFQEELDPARELHRVLLLAMDVHDGDVLVMNPDPYYTSTSAPPTPRPLVLLKVRVAEGTLHSDQGQIATSNIEGGSLRLAPTDRVWKVTGMGLPDGPSLLVCLDESGKPLAAGRLVANSHLVDGMLKTAGVVEASGAKSFRYVWVGEAYTVNVPRVGAAAQTGYP